ncbi:MAG TPA: RNA methyltransferase [Saprospiraceae bacterium]|jgi:tRNA G18 (ribose-2'-O)-methylase SpoU|nr:RNA methyltransferase [Saprospiraceae bacterium]HPI07133.1 RNA methyltransferase [Saprospiraceae bacterium]
MEKLSMDALQRLSVEDFRRQGKMPVVLVLDNVRSGLNTGSVFRTADAFLLEKVVLCGITAQPPHREILKTALGSTESVDWNYFENTMDAIRALKNEGYRVFAVEQTTDKTWLQDFEPLNGEKYAFVLGNEVDGVETSALALCDGTIEIPQFGTKHSLNVAVAAGIVVWEAVKKIKQL